MAASLRCTWLNIVSVDVQVTLMRTTPDELRSIARFITAKLNKARGPLTVLLPEGGVSLIDAEGMPFHDEDA